MQKKDGKPKALPMWFVLIMVVSIPTLIIYAAVSFSKLLSILAVNKITDDMVSELITLFLCAFINGIYGLFLLANHWSWSSHDFKIRWGNLTSEIRMIVTINKAKTREIPKPK